MHILLFLLNVLILYHKMFLFVPSDITFLNSIFPDTNISSPALLWLLFPWYTFSHLFISTYFVLKCKICFLKTVYYFFNPFCLLIKVFSLCMCNVVMMKLNLPTFYHLHFMCLMSLLFLCSFLKSKLFVRIVTDL